MDGKRTEKVLFFGGARAATPFRRAPRINIISQADIFVKRNLHKKLHKKIPKSLCILPIVIWGGCAILDLTKGKEIPR